MYVRPSLQSWVLTIHSVVLRADVFQLFIRSKKYVLAERSRWLLHRQPFFVCHLFLSQLLSSPFYSLSLLVVTEIRGHIAGSPPPLPTTVRALPFYRGKISALSSLVDSRRIVLTHATRSQALDPFFFLFFFAKKFRISPRRDSNSRTNTRINNIRGLPLDHRGDRRNNAHIKTPIVCQGFVLEVAVILRISLIHK